MADLLDAVVGVDQSGVVGRGGYERGGGQVYYTAAGIMMRIYRQSTLSQNNLSLRIQTKPALVGADATFYVRFMGQIYAYKSQPFVYE